MSKTLFTKLAERLLPDGSQNETQASELDDSFKELEQMDFSSISAAHVSNHGSVHYSSPSTKTPNEVG